MTTTLLKKICNPLGLSTAILLIALAFFWHTKNISATAQASAVRSAQNLEQAQRAATQLQKLRPQTLPLNSGQAITGLLDTAFKAAEVDNRSRRSESIRSRGALGDTGIIRQSAHVDLTNLTQTQAAKLVSAIESSNMPVWIESADMNATTSDRWTLVLDLAWLENPRTEQANPSKEQHATN